MLKRMMRLAVLATVLAVPLAADAAPTVACGNDDGRERLTPGKTTIVMEAPGVAAPELAATHAETGNLVSHHRSGRFFFLLDTAPAAGATIDASLDWESPSDYDLYLHDAAGERIASADESNVDGQSTIESLSTDVLPHCQALSVTVRNWAGIPVAERLTLTLDVKPAAPLLECAEADPAPGCAGKAAGEPPAAVADERARLYLSGTPGQASMVWDYVTTAAQDDIRPAAATLTPDRPLGGIPNQYTRPVAGFRDQYKNPFVGHFTGTLAEPRAIRGDVTGLLWLSSPLVDPTAEIIVDLYADESIVGTTVITGLADLRDPVPVRFRIPAVDVPEATTLTLQVAQDPMIATSGGTQNPADATLTIWYGGVQFQSGITLP